MTPRQLRRKYAELVIHQFIRTFGSVGIFLVLALFTPPLSTCLLPPCEVPSVVSVVPLLVLFAVSAFVAVQQQFVHRFVLFWDYLLHPDDREPARWSMLIIGGKCTLSTCVARTIEWPCSQPSVGIAALVWLGPGVYDPHGGKFLVWYQMGPSPAWVAHGQACCDVQVFTV